MTCFQNNYFYIWTL